MRRNQQLTVAALAVVLLLAAVAALPWLTDRWHEPPPLAISRVTASATGSKPVVRLEGSGFDRKLEALLLSAPAFGDDDVRMLQPGVALYHFDCNDQLGVASTRGRRLVTLDVRGGRPPRILGSVKLKENIDPRNVKITAVLLAGTRAFVGLSASEGVVMVDLTDSAVPRKLAYLRLPGAINEMVEANGRIYAASIKSGLWQLAVKGGQLQAVKVAGTGDPWRIAVAGERMAVITLRGELLLYELGSSLPRLVGRERLPQGARGVTLGRDALHLCLADGTLQEYSVAGWPRLVSRARLLLSGRPLHLLRSDDPARLFCTLAGTGVCMIDISRPGVPIVAGWLPLATPAADLVVVGGRLLTTGAGGLQIHDIEELRHQRMTVEFPLELRRERIRLLSWRGEPFACDSIRIAPVMVRPDGRPRPGMSPGESDLLAVPGDNEVRLYAPAAEPGTLPILMGRVPVTGKVMATQLHGDRLYALSESSLLIFSREPQGEFRLLERCDLFDKAQSMAWAGEDLLLIGDKSRGLTLMSVKPEGAPHAVTQQPLPAFLAKGTSGIQDVLVSGGRAFVARGEFGVQILDLTALPELKTVRQIDTPGSAVSLAMYDGLLLVADRGRGVQVIDARDEQYRWVTTLPLTTFVGNLLVAGESLLITNSASGVLRLPLPKRLPGVSFVADGAGGGPLPADLPPGKYRLVLYDNTRRAGADFTLN